jgi:transaldolase
VVIYADGAGIAQMKAYAHDSRVCGFTTNPSLMRKAGISDYRVFAAAVLDAVAGKPVSFEVLTDDLDEMIVQAHEMSEWGENVYVKIPITTTHCITTAPVIRRLSAEGVQLNVTAIMTAEQAAIAAVNMNGASGIISVFAGRIADAGVDPEPIITASVRNARSRGHRVLWASARETFNVVQAERCGADIITLTPDLIAKLDLRGKDLEQFSLETVRQFHSDGKGIAF